MIDMHEIRLGNLLIHETEGLVNIGHIQNNFYGVLLNGCSPEYFSPIPLTEEWLQRFGFVSNGGNHFWLDIGEYQLQYDVIDNSRLQPEENAELGILPPDGCTHGHTVYFPCKYVHQLQNLYFALTGEELTLKESI